MLTRNSAEQHKVAGDETAQGPKDTDIKILFVVENWEWIFIVSFQGNPLVGGFR